MNRIPLRRAITALALWGKRSVSDEACSSSVVPYGASRFSARAPRRTKRTTRSKAYPLRSRLTAGETLWLRRKKLSNYSGSQVFIHGGQLNMEVFGSESPTGQPSGRLTRNKVALVFFLLGWNLLIFGCASDEDDKPRQHHHRHRHGQDQSESWDRSNSPSPSPSSY